MTDCIIAMRSMTAAQKAERAISSKGIRCVTVNIDPSLTKRGCGYGVSLPCNKVSAAKKVLDAKRIIYGDVLGSHGEE